MAFFDSDSRLTPIITTRLTVVAGTSDGTPMSHLSNINQAVIPEIIAAIAPAALDLRQYSPNVNGTNNDTRLRMEDSPTSS